MRSWFLNIGKIGRGLRNQIKDVHAMVWVASKPINIPIENGVILSLTTGY